MNDKLVSTMLYAVTAFAVLILLPGCFHREIVCDDAADNDGDGYIDCFDANCACVNTGGPIPDDECACVLEEGAPVCWLDHTAQTCRYTDDYRSDRFGFGGRYPVADVDVCIAGCEKFGYLKTVRTSVIVDDSSYMIANTEIAAAVELASKRLFALSGAEMALHSIDHVPSILGSKTAFIDSWYLTHSTDPPHFIIIISRDETSVTYGGYAVSSSVLTGFCNDFVSPVLGNQRIYGAVIDWTHRFAACGYDLDHYKTTGQWVAVSTTSLADGSCINQADVACVSVTTVSYQVCGNVAPDLPYLADERAFALSMFIHEIMHAFGTNGNFDHFGTGICDAAMGGTGYQAGGRDTSQHHCGMCPIVYENFAASYSACP